MNRNQLVLLAALGSAALLIGAWTFQYFGYAPCKLCYWQRYPHMVAVVIGAAALASNWRALPLLGAGAALTTAVLGIYHTGVERAWWQGPDTCTSGAIEGVSTDDLLNQILQAPLVQCDQVAWDLYGISMASWNAIFSLGLVVLWLMAWRRA